MNVVHHTYDVRTKCAQRRTRYTRHFYACTTSVLHTYIVLTNCVRHVCIRTRYVVLTYDMCTSVQNVYTERTYVHRTYNTCTSYGQDTYITQHACKTWSSLQHTYNIVHQKYNVCTRIYEMRTSPVWQYNIRTCTHHTSDTCTTSVHRTTCTQDTYIVYMCARHVHSTYKIRTPYPQYGYNIRTSYVKRAYNIVQKVYILNTNCVKRTYMIPTIYVRRKYINVRTTYDHCVYIAHIICTSDVRYKYVCSTRVQHTYNLYNTRTSYLQRVYNMCTSYVQHVYTVRT